MVGIGASAGGLEATATLLAGLPADCGLAIVIVQHLDPTFPSQAAELLGRRTALPVEVAKDDIELQPNHVYTLPSDLDAYLEGGRLRLAKQPPRPKVHLPIDRFLTSLGEQLAERAIGIVLSGTGSDGSVGMGVIAAHGGITLAQEPRTAAYSGMPQSAIATGKISSVLAVADMPAFLCAYARHPYATNTADASALGSDSRMVMRRIERRMGLRHVLKVADYTKLVRTEPDELDALRRDLLIGVTGFFRDAEAWKVLERDAVEPIFAERSETDTLRVWVAGTSTGEEAYSMAMLLMEARTRLGRTCPIQIFATDASEEAIAFARRGRYPAGIAEAVSPERLQRFFERRDDGQQYEVRPELRACVIFGGQKLIDDPPFSRLDLISCRNVLMYLEMATQKRVLGLLQASVRPGGYLFLGTAESADSGKDLLRPISKRWRIYQRSGEALPVMKPALGSVSAPRALLPMPPQQLPARLARESSSSAEQILLERYCAAAFLVNRAGDALYLYGRTDSYLARRSGAPTQNLLSMLRWDLRAAVRRALQNAWSGELHAVLEDARVRRDNTLATVRVSVVPAAGSRAPAPLWLVVLQDGAPAGNAKKPVRGALASVVKQLEAELLATQQDLRNSVEQMEVSTQDLRSSNEELVTVNEELQVANEELQSSKEELQSLNEERQTVNQQLQSKVAELETSGNDLDNLLASIQIITICFDRDLRVRWFSPTARDTFKLLPNDIGRAMATFGDAPIGPSAAMNSSSVLLGATSAVAEVKWQERWYVRRVLPYRIAQNQIHGVILTLTDITESKEAAEARLQERAAQATTLTKAVADRTAQLRKLSEALTLTEERERRAIAVDLHDDLGQLIALLKIRFDLMQKKELATPIAEDLQGASALLQQASDRVRSLAFQLSPTILYELGLIPALEWLADEMKRLYGIEVTIEADKAAQRSLDPSVRAVLFRAVRELLINVGKHAKTGAAKVKCQRHAGRMTITVSDRGKGFDSAVLYSASEARGLGLLSVRERLGGLGGSMTCDSTPGDGSRVTLELPIPGAAKEL
ncbi:MAG: PAS domain-containing protein [Proteobacteria bacterium]|nr:PAS domain-containing protein [Pseudomonadota bacterium]